MVELTVHDGLLAVAKRSKKEWFVTKQSVEPLWKWTSLICFYEKFIDQRVDSSFGEEERKESQSDQQERCANRRERKGR